MCLCEIICVREVILISVNAYCMGVHMHMEGLSECFNVYVCLCKTMSCVCVCQCICVMFMCQCKCVMFMCVSVYVYVCVCVCMVCGPPSCVTAQRGLTKLLVRVDYKANRRGVRRGEGRRTPVA